MSVINFPILYINDPLIGRPLFQGQVFVGIEGLDPQIVGNQKQLNVIEGDGNVVAVPQPFILSAGGVPVYNGNPVRLDVDGNYSIKILNKLGAQTYYVENIFEGQPITELELINDLSQAYEFATVAEYKAFTTPLPVGKIVNLLDRQASFTVLSGTGTATGNRVIASDEVSQSVELIIKDFINLREFGAIADDITTSGAIAEAFAYQDTLNIPIKIPESGPISFYLVDEQLSYYGYGIKGDGRNNSRIKSSYVGTLIKKMHSNDEGTVEDFSLWGIGVAGVDDGIGEGFGPDGVIGMGADGGGAGWSRMQMKNVHFRHMAQQMEIDKSLWCIFNTVYARFVKRGVFFVGGGAGWNSSWFNNAITFINCLWDDTGEYAIDYVGSNLSLTGTVTFQSGVDGLRINRDPSGRSNNNVIDNIYTEFNSGSDIVLDGVKLTLGTAQYQGGDGSASKPNTANNILANNSDIIALGRPSILDGQVKRITLTNNSNYTAMYPEIVSVKNTADATSEFVYLPDRVDDKTIEDVFNGLSSVTPEEISGGNISTRSWSCYLSAPNGENTSFDLYAGLIISSFKIKAVGLNVVEIDANNFTINFGTVDYTFSQSSVTGVITIVAESFAAGDVVFRRTQKIGLNVPTY